MILLLQVHKTIENIIGNIVEIILFFKYCTIIIIK